MTGRTSERSSEDDVAWESVLAQCLQCLEKGESVDPQGICRDPRQIQELVEFIAAHEAISARFQRAREAVVPTSPQADRVLANQDEVPGELRANTPLDSNYVIQAGSSTFGAYELIREVNRGGMGVVFEARHRALDRRVALKMIKTGHLAGEEEIRRFHIEARVAASLDHPGIVPVFDVGEERGIHFYAMAYVEGQTLAELIATQPLDPQYAAGIAQRSAVAVEYAHERGIVHRDLKPGNVLIDASGAPRVMDFGLAKQIHRDDGLTQTGQVLGTPAYISPEQVRGNVARPQSSDIYGLGACLYAMITGVPPHQATSSLELLLRVLEAEPLSPRRVNPVVPRRLEQICLRCLEKDPLRRYATMAELAADLTRFLHGEPIHAGQRGVFRQLQSWARCQPALAAHLAGLLPTLIVVQAVYLNQVILRKAASYNFAHSGALVAWILSCFGLQRLLMRFPRAYLVRYGWAAVDVALMTLIIALASPPRGQLLVGYSVLIVASGMFLREKLVLTTTGLASAGYCLLLWLSWLGLLDVEWLPRPSYSLLYVVGLNVLGCLVAVYVRRLHVLSRYYER